MLSWPRSKGKPLRYFFFPFKNHLGVVPSRAKEKVDCQRPIALNFVLGRSGKPLK